MRLLYVMGFGRSGSTVLASILGNHPDAVNLGEICSTPQRGWVEDDYCSCKKRTRACPFWEEVRRDWIERIGSDDIAAQVTLCRRIESRPTWYSRWLSARQPSAIEFEKYTHTSLALFSALRQASRCSILVDASKSPYRALALSQIPGVDIRILHLVRDVRGVAWSQKRKLVKDVKQGTTNPHSPRSACRAALNWVRCNRMVDIISSRLPEDRVIRLRYEDLMCRPDAVLKSIGAMADIDFSQPIHRIKRQEPLEIGHLVAGNRLRMAGPLRLRADIEWMTKMSRTDRWTCWLIAGWLLRRYGYSYQPTSIPSLPEKLGEPHFPTKEITVAGNSDANHRGLREDSFGSS